MNMALLKSFLTAAAGVLACAGALGPATAAERFVMTACQSGECVWSAAGEPVMITKNERGTLIASTMHFCVERSGSRPKSYQCQTSTVLTTDKAAFCSLSHPSLATKEKGKWRRTRLSISDDGEYGYNREEITDYLRLCHAYLRPVTGGPSLDIIGARFGYRSRYGSLGDSEHDEVAELRDLVE